MRRQTRAVVALLRASEGLSSHFLFMEDDFLLCPHALRTLEYIITKAHAYYSGVAIEHYALQRLNSGALDKSSVRW